MKQKGMGLIFSGIGLIAVGYFVWSVIDKDGLAKVTAAVTGNQEANGGPTLAPDLRSDAIYLDPLE